ncbi:MAG: response regulator [Pirellulales bacterium]|nr:response regulator [Pirellulales bacterium]
MSLTHPILHVDDDPAITRLVTTALRKRGLQAAELNDPGQVLAAIAEHDYRVVLLDIDMPGINGMDLLRSIKLRDASVNVIVFTGLKTPLTASTAMRHGALACLFKPMTDVQPMVDVIQLAFNQINRWNETLMQVTVATSSQTEQFAALSTATC